MSYSSNQQIIEMKKIYILFFIVFLSSCRDEKIEIVLYP